MSAMKSGMSRNTARKYLGQKDAQQQRAIPHSWKTRKDPLEKIWAQAQEMLRKAGAKPPGYPLDCFARGFVVRAVVYGREYTTALDLHKILRRS